ncbi:MAG: hypothetical protein GTO14_07305 [Anaerolineales bacterium]|nr:hypothetical protein [Anaerolineales bacterium]
MIPVTRRERQWFLRNLAQGLADYLGVMEPPVSIEDLLQNPPHLYHSDFGVVDTYSSLWDATFARPPSQRGSIFVRNDLEPEERRFALARETLSAIITSKHGRAMGLFDLIIPHLRESAEYFARFLLAPPRLFEAYRNRNGDVHQLAKDFQIPGKVASKRLEDSEDDNP